MKSICSYLHIKCKILSRLRSFDCLEYLFLLFPLMLELRSEPIITVIAKEVFKINCSRRHDDIKSASIHILPLAKAED